MKGQHYYDQLTPEQQERWRHNTEERGRKIGRNNWIKDQLKTEKEDMQAFISGSFIWSETPEGHKYWSSIADNPPPKNLAQALTPPPLMPRSHQEPIYNSGVMLGVFIGFLTGTLLTMATREWVWQLIGLDIVIIAGIVYLYKRYRSEHHQGR